MNQSTLSDKSASWKRLRREVLRVIVLLLILELICRIDPVRSWLTSTLDPYENLLWYSDVMPAYRDQLRSGQHYDVWMVGSSYMMTGLNPAWVQQEFNQVSGRTLTFQNYGMADLQNLHNMVDVINNWMLPMDRPDYMVIGLSIFNFSPAWQLPANITRSPMEAVYIFPDSLDDYVASFLYDTSAVYRYSLLARNATFVPREDTIVEPKPLGGFIDSANVIDYCEAAEWQDADRPQTEYYKREGVFEPLDHFIQVIEAQAIPYVVVDIPLQYCNMRRFFNSYDSYKANYLDPLTNHLAERGIPFLELAELLYSEIPTEDHFNYYMDFHHPNREGARLFSKWTADYVAAWMDTIETDS